MKYLYAITTVSIPEIETAIGKHVNALTEGSIPHGKGIIEGILIDIEGDLTPLQTARLKLYLSFASRETLTPLP